ncbi:MAG TPA: ADP-ribosylglycohydrolase family protein, partial [Spirochaetia bacterium]
ALEMVPCALALVTAARGDARQAILGAAHMGRDADTIASMAGELAGALGGADALPAEWVERILACNPRPDLDDYARRLTELILRRTEVAAERAAGLLRGWRQARPAS